VSSRAAASLAFVIALAFVASCEACKTDAQRAADERATIDKIATLFRTATT